MIPSDLCLDASVFVSALSREERHHQSALDLMALVRERQIPLYEPALVLYEVVSTLYRKQLAGEVSEAAREELVDHFYQLPLLFQWEPGLIHRASEIAARLSFRKIYDCTYLAIAQARNIPFLTFDEELIKKGRRIFQKVHTPEEFNRLVSAESS